MLTIFTTAKPFRGHSAVIQRNAVRSWKILHPHVEIIMFGNEEGVAEMCAEVGARHEARTALHESGFPYLNAIFEEAQRLAKHEYACFVNCDIILREDFWEAFQKVVEWRDQFLMIGRRWDTNVVEPIPFESKTWSSDLRRKALAEGVKQKPTYIDLFVFRKGMYTNIPPMIVSRSYWDGWIVGSTLARRIGVVDCTDFVVTVHQNHDYAYHPQGKVGTHGDFWAMRNYELAGGKKQLRWIEDATFRFTRDGRIRKDPIPGFVKRRFRIINENFNEVLIPKVQPAWHYILGLTRPIRSRLGLRSSTTRRKRMKDVIVP